MEGEVVPTIAGGRECRGVLQFRNELHLSLGAVQRDIEDAEVAVVVTGGSPPVAWRADGDG